MKKFVCLLLILGLGMAWSVSAFAAASTSILSEKTVVSRILNIMREGEKLTIALLDGEITQYSAENGDIVHVTSFEDGRMRYECYCCKAEKIYSFYDENLNENVDTTDINQQSIKMEIFDAAEYRKKNIEKYESDHQDKTEMREVIPQKAALGSPDSDAEAKKRLFQQCGILMIFNKLLLGI